MEDDFLDALRYDIAAQVQVPSDLLWGSKSSQDSVASKDFLTTCEKFMRNVMRQTLKYPPKCKSRRARQRWLNSLRKAFGLCTIAECRVLAEGRPEIDLPTRLRLI